MKSVSEIMEELGFRPDARDSVKAAFIKNLWKQAFNVDVKLPEKYEIELKNESPTEQLSFNIEEPAIIKEAK